MKLKTDDLESLLAKAKALGASRVGLELVKPDEPGKQPDPRFLTIKDSAEYASLSVASIRRMISTGKVTALRPVRGRIIIDKRELDSVIQASSIKVRGGRGRAA